MNIKDIAALAEIVKQNELTKLEINGENIVIERAAQVVQAAPILNAVQPAVPEQMHTTEPIAEVKEKEGVYVKSPAVGVFYAAPSPDSKPFVAVGDTVHKGDTLCIIEAMKLMNEINSEMDGEIAEIWRRGNGRSSNTTSRCSALFKMKSSRSAVKKMRVPGIFPWKGIR